MASISSSSSSTFSTPSLRCGGILIDTIFGECFLLTSRGSVIDLRGLAAFLLASDGEMARLSNGDVCGEVLVFLMEGESSHTL